ncbi:MAG TPA: hypothetical protein VH436_16970 [Vicinamibacterales bacterium]
MTMMRDATPVRAAVSDSLAPATTDVRWSPATKVAFRLCFVYFGLYVLTTQMISSMVRLPIGIPPLSVLPPVRNAFLWVGANVLRISDPINVAGSGSGDTLIDWVEAFSLVLAAVAATTIWSVLDRRRAHYRTLNTWFRPFLRFALGTTMVGYGLSKVIPLQMPVVFLTRLVEPFGNFSPMGVLWTSIGASPAYESFVGCAELAGGALLFVPRTTLVGALICVMDAIAIFTLNMTYDVPVKLFSFHLILLSLFLVAPNIRPLLRLLLMNGSASASVEPPLGRTRRSRRIWNGVQVVYGSYFVLLVAAGYVVAWKQAGGGAPNPPLFGIWDVEQMTIDGQEHPPLVTDRDRWRRVIFQQPTAVTFQRMDDTFERFATAIDADRKTIALTVAATKTSSTLSFARPTPEQLIIDGPINGRTVHLELKLRDLNSFLLHTRGFNWVQEVPFNR